MVLYINSTNHNLITVSLKKKNKIIKTLSKKNEYGSQVLLPLIVKLLYNQNLEFFELKGIEVEEGPGSFTGLRVGASVAQALGFALKVPVNGKVGKALKISYT